MPGFHKGIIVFHYLFPGKFYSGTTGLIVTDTSAVIIFVTMKVAGEGYITAASAVLLFQKV